MSAARNAEAKRVTSIARAINWSYMWRRLMSYVWLDLLLVVIVAAILVYGYNQTLPNGAFTAGWIPSATVRGMTLTPARGWDLTTLTYTVELARTTKTFPLAQDLVTLWPLYLVVVGWQVISMLDMLGGARRVRRTMAPLNDLALRVDELGRMQLSGGKMETLEQAIERASVDSPSVTTGDADLASIEVALNRLLRQMQEAKLQQMRFVNDASHELRTPIAVIQGYVNMLDRWGKDDPDVLAESIASLKAESEHMQELVEQLLFLARGDAGRTVLRRAHTNLAALVGEVCEESQMIDAEHTYRLAFDALLASDPRCDAPVDVALVKQALRVIVQNAAKYSDAGTTVTFGITPNAGMGTIDISVEDEGIGMNQESAAHAFERFYRADNARDAGAQGSRLKYTSLVPPSGSSARDSSLTSSPRSANHFSAASMSLTAKPMWPLVPRPFCFMISTSESLKYETGVSVTGRPIIVENSSAISRASAGSVALMPTWATRIPKSSTGLAFCSLMQSAPTEP
jgi:signal transduction histidine kinase